jgi:hypothetical protein
MCQVWYDGEPILRHVIAHPPAAPNRIAFFRFLWYPVVKDLAGCDGP